MAASAVEFYGAGRFSPRQMIPRAESYLVPSFGARLGSRHQNIQDLEVESLFEVQI
jgi:hypothetical protein